MYMMVDMGAGTTEFSINHVGQSGADQKVLCYSDRSSQIGGDNFEWLDVLETDPVARQRAHARLLKSFRKSFQSTWYSGFQKDCRRPAAKGRWRKVIALLAGGGSRRQEVKTRVAKALPFRPFPVAEAGYSVMRYAPTNIAAPDATMKLMNDDSSLLAVAHGLSVEVKNWPEWFAKSQIEQLDPPERIPEPPPYWYVGGK
jgi:hypothetical protein